MTGRHRAPAGRHRRPVIAVRRHRHPRRVAFVFALAGATLIPLAQPLTDAVLQARPPVVSTAPPRAERPELAVIDDAGTPALAVRYVSSAAVLRAGTEIGEVPWQPPETGAEQEPQTQEREETTGQDDPTPEPDVEESDGEPTQAPEPEDAPDPTVDTTPESTTEAPPETTTEPEPTPEPEPEPTTTIPEPTTTTPKPEPTPEPEPVTSSPPSTLPSCDTPGTDGRRG